HMLFLAAGVGETKIDEFNVFILDCLEYVFWGHNLFLPFRKPEFCFLYGVRGRESPKNGQHSAINKKSLRPLKNKIEDFVVAPGTSLCRTFMFYTAEISSLSTRNSAFYALRLWCSG